MFYRGTKIEYLTHRRETKFDPYLIKRRKLFRRTKDPPFTSSNLYLISISIYIASYLNKISNLETIP